MTRASDNLRYADVIFMSGHNFRYAFTRLNQRICRSCCGLERRRFALDDRWMIRSDQVNKTGVPIKCDNCGREIIPK